MERFERCLALNPEDKLSQTYIDRCNIPKPMRYPLIGTRCG